MERSGREEGRKRAGKEETKGEWKGLTSMKLKASRKLEEL